MIKVVNVKENTYCTMSYLQVIVVIVALYINGNCHFCFASHSGSFH